MGWVLLSGRVFRECSLLASSEHVLSRHPPAPSNLPGCCPDSETSLVQHREGKHFISKGWEKGRSSGQRGVGRSRTIGRESVGPVTGHFCTHPSRLWKGMEKSSVTSCLCCKILSCSHLTPSGIDFIVIQTAGLRVMEVRDPALLGGLYSCCLHSWSAQAEESRHTKI